MGRPRGVPGGVPREQRNALGNRVHWHRMSAIRVAIGGAWLRRPWSEVVLPLPRFPRTSAPPAGSVPSSPPVVRPWRTAARVLVAALVMYGLLWLTGVLGILGATLVARQSQPAGVRMEGINHFVAVDDEVLRGSAPGDRGYRALARRGVTTVVDLRAEELSHRQLSAPGRAGLRLVRLPVRDGQTPTPRQVERFLATVEQAGGRVFVHCGAGVGRSGSMSAAYLVRTGQESPAGATFRNLAVGPPSLEQIYYAWHLRRDASAQPPLVVRAVSRALDAPRRLWSSW